MSLFPETPPLQSFYGDLPLAQLKVWDWEWDTSAFFYFKSLLSLRLTNYTEKS
jgi:hypothetical protein